MLVIAESTIENCILPENLNSTYEIRHVTDTTEHKQLKVSKALKLSEFIPFEMVADDGSWFRLYEQLNNGIELWLYHDKINDAYYVVVDNKLKPNTFVVLEKISKTLFEDLKSKPIKLRVDKAKYLDPNTFQFVDAKEEIIEIESRE